MILIHFFCNIRFGWFVYSKISGRCWSQTDIAGGKRCPRWKGEEYPCFPLILFLFLLCPSLLIVPFQEGFYLFCLKSFFILFKHSVAQTIARVFTIPIFDCLPFSQFSFIPLSLSLSIFGGNRSVLKISSFTTNSVNCRENSTAY